MAKVVAVNISQHKGTFKYPVPLGHATVDHGLVGDAHAGNWHRQISLLAQESIDKMTALGVSDLPRGNLRKTSPPAASNCTPCRWGPGSGSGIAWRR